MNQKMNRYYVSVVDDNADKHKRHQREVGSCASCVWYKRSNRKDTITTKRAALSILKDRIESQDRRIDDSEFMISRIKWSKPNYIPTPVTKETVKKAKELEINHYQRMIETARREKRISEAAKKKVKGLKLI